MLGYEEVGLSMDKYSRLTHSVFLVLKGGLILNKLRLLPFICIYCVERQTNNIFVFIVKFIGFFPISTFQNDNFMQYYVSIIFAKFMKNC